MNTNLTNINVVGSPDYYLELESGKTWGNVSLTRDSTTTDIQLSNCCVYYRFKLTLGNLSYQNAPFYTLYSTTGKQLTVYAENGIIKFRLSDGPDYTDIATLNIAVYGGLIQLNHWYELVIYQDSGVRFALRDGESDTILTYSNPYTDALLFDISGCEYNFNTISNHKIIVSKDSKITIESTSKTVLDLSEIEWDPVPSVNSFGTTNAI